VASLATVEARVVPCVVALAGGDAFDASSGLGRLARLALAVAYRGRRLPLLPILLAGELPLLSEVELATDGDLAARKRLIAVVGCDSSYTCKLGTLFVSVKYVLVNAKLVYVYVKLLKI
jgi:hypothetical protein